VFQQPFTYSTNANISQTFFQGGRIFAGTRAAGDARQAARYDQAETRARVSVDVQRAYFQALLSDRLVTKNGILFMGAAALIVILLARGSVKLLVVFYSINVFITFVLSQLGMVRYWRRARAENRAWKRKLAVNAVGLLLSAAILMSVVIMKFNQGGWITLLITGSLIGIVVYIKQHYANTFKILLHLDDLVKATDLAREEELPGMDSPIPFNPGSKTAVLMVNGYNGLGLHTLLSVQGIFRGMFKNFVFVRVGIIDSGAFKGREEIDHLKAHIQHELDRYVSFVRREGYYAEAVPLFGVDVVEEITKAAPVILARYPDSVFFGGQLVFPEEVFLARWLHNYTVFAIQRRFYYQGINIMLIPIRLENKLQAAGPRLPD
jgi:NADH:ubiquinone oxidoreductase subunit 6 (subunit J)